MPEGMIASLSTFGNPLVWWGGLASVVYIVVQKIRRKKFGVGLGFVAVAALSEYLPWVLISRETFIYHYFATVPFLIIIMTFALRYIVNNYRHGKKFMYIFLGACLLLFILFYPMITGIPVSQQYANAIRWLPSWPFY